MSLLLGLAPPQPAAAQTAAPAGPIVLPPVTVTGEKVVRDLQDTPESVAVLTREEIETAPVRDLLDVYRRTPNVQTFVDGRGAAIRGIGQTGFGFSATPFTLTRGPGDLVTTYLDGVPVSTFAGPVSTWDLEQVEIYRGAQSTTFGRGALGGVVVQNSVDPSDRVEVAARGLRGTQGMWEGSAAVGPPVVAGRAAVRLSADLGKTDGSVDNRTRGDPESVDDRRFARGKVLLTPSEDLSLTLTAFAGRREVGSGFADAAFYPDDRVVFSNVPDRVENDFVGASLKGTYLVGESSRVEALTAFGREDADRRIDGDLSPADLVAASFADDVRSVSQEVRFHHEPGGRWQGFVGAYHQRFDGDTDELLDADSGFFGLPPGLRLEQRTRQEIDVDTYALFGEGELRVLPRLRLIAGGRVERETNETRVAGREVLSHGRGRVRAARRFAVPDRAAARGRPDRGEPFAIVASHRAEKEDPAEAARRARWYKEREAALAAVCRGMVCIEPDDAERAALEAQLAKLRATFPVPLRFVADEAEALAVARGCLRPPGA